MEIRVDINKLNKDLVNFDKLISEYKDINIDIYKEINKLDSYWSGTNKDRFMEIVNKEKANYYKDIEIIDKVFNIYRSIGINYKDNIYYNDLNKNRVLGIINNNIEELKKVNNNIREELPYDSNCKSILENTKIELYSIYDELNNYKYNLELMLDKVEKNELEILGKINI